MVPVSIELTECFCGAMPQYLVPFACQWRDCCIEWLSWHLWFRVALEIISLDCWLKWRREKWIHVGWLGWALGMIYVVQLTGFEEKLSEVCDVRRALIVYGTRESGNMDMLSQGNKTLLLGTVMMDPCHSFRYVCRRLEWGVRFRCREHKRL